MCVFARQLTGARGDLRRSIPAPWRVSTALRPPTTTKCLILGSVRGLSRLSSSQLQLLNINSSMFNHRVKCLYRTNWSTGFCNLRDAIFHFQTACMSVNVHRTNACHVSSVRDGITNSGTPPTSRARSAALFLGLCSVSL